MSDKKDKAPVERWMITRERYVQRVPLQELLRAFVPEGEMIKPGKWTVERAGGAVNDDEKKARLERIRQGVKDGTIKFEMNPIAEKAGRFAGKDEKPDFTIVATDCDDQSERSFALNWATRSAGFGQFTFWLDSKKGDRLRCDNEGMGRHMVREALERYMMLTPRALWPALLRARAAEQGLAAFLNECEPTSNWSD